MAVLLEDFEDTTYVTPITLGTWIRSAQVGRGGTYAAIAEAEGGEVSDMTITLPANTASIQFWYRMESWTAGDAFHVRVNNATIHTITADTQAFTQSDIIPIPAGATQVVFRLQAGAGSFVAEFRVDDLAITTQEASGVAFDTSSPNMANTTTASVVSASFTPPSGSLLVAMCSGPSSTHPTVTNSGAALPWTTQKQWVANGITTSSGRIYTAPLDTSRALTVTATAGASGAAMLKVLVFTGVDLANPAVPGNTNSTATMNATVTGYTSTVAGSRGVCYVIDTNGNPTGTSSDLFQARRVLNQHGGMAVWKAENTATPGTNVTFNFNGGTSQRDWEWSAIEILPATGGVITQVFAGWGIPIK